MCCGTNHLTKCGNLYFFKLAHFFETGAITIQIYHNAKIARKTKHSKRALDLPQNRVFGERPNALSMGSFLNAIFKGRVSSVSCEVGGLQSDFYKNVNVQNGDARIL